MREFGLDETQLTEEEVTKRRQELKTLIKMGKTRGFLTHQEINDHLPEKLVDNEIEAIVSMLNDMGIAVYEQAPDAADAADHRRRRHHHRDEEEAEEAAEAALSTVDSSSAAPPTRCACTCARWARSSCSRARARSRSPSASKAACRP